jgi:hypothetical protein
MTRMNLEGRSDVDLHNLRTAFEIGMEITKEQSQLIVEKNAEIDRLNALIAERDGFIAELQRDLREQAEEQR